MSYLHEPGHNMNLCKVMQSQSKYMKSTWSTSRGCGAGHMRFQGAKKRLAKVQDMNTLVDSAVLEVLRQNTRAKSMTTHNSCLEYESETFNLKNIITGEE